MTDFALQAPDLATFEAAGVALGIADEEGFVRNQGRMADGTEWFLDLIGQIFQPTGQTIDGEFGPMPEMAPRAGVYANLRWNGPADIPDPAPLGVEIVWRSDGEEPLPAWWSRVIA